MWVQVEKIYEKKSSEGLMSPMIRKLTEKMKGLKYRTGYDIGDHLTNRFSLRRQLKD